MPVYSYALKDGSRRWMVKVNHRDWQHVKRGFRTKAAAQAYERMVRDELERGLIGHSGITIAELAQLWLENRRPRVKRSTLEDYATQLELRILPVFGKRKAGHISSLELQAYLNGLSPRLAQKTRFGLGGMYRLAMRHGLVRLNPVVAVEARKAQPTGGRALTLGEVRAILAHLEKPWRQLVLLLVCTGLRIGEALALTWADIQPDYISVDKAWRKGRLDSPKTFRSLRQLAISPSLYHELTALRGEAGEDGLVFPHPATGRHMESWNLWQRLNTAAARAGLGRVRIHDLRHTYTSWLAQGGQELRLAMDQLGHADVTTTLRIYTHVLESSRDRYRQWLESEVIPELTDSAVIPIRPRKKS